MDDTANTFETNSISVPDFLPNKLNLSLFGAWRTDRLLSGEKKGPGSIPFNRKCHARCAEKIIGSQASSSLFSCVIPLSPSWRVPHSMQKPHCGSSYNYVKRDKQINIIFQHRNNAAFSTHGVTAIFSCLNVVIQIQLQDSDICASILVTTVRIEHGKPSNATYMRRQSPQDGGA
jgi:hypothetical protein